MHPSYSHKHVTFTPPPLLDFFIYPPVSVYYYLGVLVFTKFLFVSGDQPLFPFFTTLHLKYINIHTEVVGKLNKFNLPS